MQIDFYQLKSIQKISYKKRNAFVFSTRYAVLALYVFTSRCSGSGGWLRCPSAGM